MSHLVVLREDSTSQNIKIPVPPKRVSGYRGINCGESFKMVSSPIWRSGTPHYFCPGARGFLSLTCRDQLYVDLEASDTCEGSTASELPYRQTKDSGTRQSVRCFFERQQTAIDVPQKREKNKKHVSVNPCSFLSPTAHLHIAGGRIHKENPKHRRHRPSLPSSSCHHPCYPRIERACTELFEEATVTPCCTTNKVLYIVGLVFVGLPWRMSPGLQFEFV